MNNTKTKSSDSSTKIEEAPKQYIKNVASGFIYQIGKDAKNKNIALLRKGNLYTKFLISDIKNGIVSGVWKEPNEHEIKAFVKQDNEYFQALNY